MYSISVNTHARMIWHSIWKNHAWCRACLVLVASSNLLAEQANSMYELRSILTHKNRALMVVLVIGRKQI